MSEPSEPRIPIRSPIRSRRPSFTDLPELYSDLSTSHRLDSDPAGARWLDRRIGRAIRIGLRWFFRTKTGTAVAAGLAAGVTWLSQHFLHWIR